MAEVIEVLARGKLLRGWKSVTITRAIDAAAVAFEVSGPARSPYPIAPGDEVEVYASGERILRGFAERLQRRLDADGSTVTVSGRDRVADLIDCTAANEPGEWTNVELEQLAVELAKPFGVSVDYSAGAKPAFEVFSLRPGDTAWGALERACRMRGVLAYSNGEGRLQIRRPGQAVAPVELIEGQNLRAASYTVDDSARFRFYRVQGQRRGSDSAWGEQVALIEGEAEDRGARSPRQLVILAESMGTNQTAQERAQWEAIVRAAEAVQLEAEASGWRQNGPGGGGALWQPNEELAVRAPSLDLDGYLLVRAVTFRQAEREESTFLELVRPDAYQPQPALAAEDDLAEGWRSSTTAGEGEPDDLDPDDSALEQFP